MKTGDVMVVWESGNNKGDNAIVYRIWNKERDIWFPPVGQAPYVAASGVRNAQYPQLVEDSSGAVHMSFMDGDASYNRDVYYRYYKGGVWSKAVNVCPTAVNSAWPRISLDTDSGTLFVSWQHMWNNRFDGKDIVFVTKKLAENSWSEMRQLSSTPDRQSIHQATVCWDGHLWGVWMDGFADRDVWGLRFGWSNDGRGLGNGAELVGAVAVHQPQWPDLAIDSAGNILGIYSQRNAPLRSIWKPWNQSRLNTSFLADGGGITFYGVTIARNDVAYCMYRRNAGNGFLPVLIRFDGETVAEPEFLEHTALRPAVWLGHMDVGVSLEGTAHMVWSSGEPSHVPTAIRYARQGRHPEAPEVSIKISRRLRRQIELIGTLQSGHSEIRHQCWYVPALGIWKHGERLEIELPVNDKLPVYYIVGDQNHLYGYAGGELREFVVPAGRKLDRQLRQKRKDID